MSFRETVAAGLSLWHGDPDCDAAHALIASWLAEMVTEYLEVGTPPSTRVVGNVSEMIVFRLGRTYVFNDGAVLASAPNARQPLSDISHDGVDIVWLSFGDHREQDWVALQEVKATGDSSLAYASALEGDYDKLFGTRPQLTLQVRLDALKSMLEYEMNRADLAHRLTSMGAPSPAQATRIRLMPTLVHESRSADPQARMLAVRQYLVASGWDAAAVSCWSVGLDDFNSRIARLVSNS